MKHHGVGAFDAYSAGSMCRGEIHPYAVDLLRHYEHDVSVLPFKILGGIRR